MKVKKQYPKWLYHAEKPALIVQDAAEHEEKKREGYGNRHEVSKPAQELVQDEKPPELLAVPPANQPEQKPDYAKMTVKELAQALLDRGAKREDLLGKKKAELVALCEAEA